MSPTKKTLVEAYPLRTVKVLKRTLLYAGVPSLVGLVSAVASIFVEPILSPLILVLTLGFFFLAYYYNLLYLRKYFYDLTKDGLVIGKGVIGSWRITVPANKIQDVYLDQDLLDRIFGLYDLHMSTATEASAQEAHIDGLGREDAEKLRSILLEWLTGVAKPAQDSAETALHPGKPGLTQLVLTRSLAALVLLLYLLGGYGLLSAFLVVPLVVLVAYLDYISITYVLRPDGVLVRSGYFIPKESIFLYRNIQDVEDHQDLWDRIFSTHTLVIKTMTSSSALVGRLQYLQPDVALDMRNVVLERCKKQNKAEVEHSASAADKVVGSAGRKPPQIKTLNSPYKNDFLKSANYQAAFTAAVGVVVIPLISALIIISGGLLGQGGMGMAFLVSSILGGVVVLLIVLTYAGAFISQISYSFAVAGEYVQVQMRFIRTTQRQMFYRKIQDIEKHVSFANSFARLADIKLETGSKELIQGRREEYATSVNVGNEMIPSLAYEDSEELKEKVAAQMGISLDGLGKNPLSGVIPLEDVKPLKKTLSWAFAAVVLCILAFIVVSLSYLPRWIPLVIASLSVAALGLKYWYEVEYLKRYFYDANDSVLVIRKGVFGSRELMIPLEKIQDIYVSRDIFDLMFGLYDVYVSTATSRSLLDAHIDGLNVVNAEACALFIAEKISINK